MKPKKYPKADLNRKSGLFFVIGLVIVLFFVWRALELKTYPKEKAAIEQILISDYLEEKVPVTEALNVPPPPPPPAAPEVIEIVEDVAEIEETVIQSTEINQETVVEDTPLQVEDIAVVEEEEDIEVPFAVIENAPVFPGCEEASNDARKACFQKKIQEHIIKQFTYPDVAVELGIEGKVYVQFIIDKTGYINNIRTRGPDKLLEKEANRIIAALPQMTPGKQRGRPVKVPYTIPITFRLQ